MKKNKICKTVPLCFAVQDIRPAPTESSQSDFSNMNEHATVC